MSLPSASSISMTTIRWVHVIKLSGYSHAKRLLNTGECVESAVFHAAGHSWRVLLYPNGGNEECVPGSIALYLQLVSKPNGDVRAKLQFSLLRHGSKLLLSSVHDVGRTPDLPVTFNANVGDWGFEDVGVEGELEKPEYVEDDTILVRCDIIVANELVVERRDLEALDLCDCSEGHLLAGSRKKESSQSHVTASTIDVTASTGCHVIKVSGYSHTNLLPHIKSTKFKEAGHAWRILCVPDGDSEEIAGHVSLYLQLASYESTDVHAEYQFSLVMHGQLLTSAPHNGQARGDRATFRSSHADICFGIMNFMAREELEESEYLKDDCFYIRCDIAALNKPVAKLLHDADAIGILCYCNNDGCGNIHGHDKVEADAYSEPRRCLPIRSKPSQRRL